MKIVSSLMLIVIMASIASAEIMSTGDPIGQGKFAVSGNYVKDSKVGTIGTDDMNMSTWGGTIGYGLTDKLDLYLTASSSNVGNMPTGVARSAATIGLVTNYQFMEEGANSSISVAGRLGYKSMSFSATSFSVTANNIVSQYMAAVEISKKLSAFTPYVGFGYCNYYSGGSDPSTQLGVTVGGSYAWLPNSSILVELTSNTVSASWLPAFSNSQIGVGINYYL
ncbi:MAG: hypothetical protein ABIH56_07180 [Candidatus Margulisiibacteriota bacterium]